MRLVVLMALALGAAMPASAADLVGHWSRTPDCATTDSLMTFTADGHAIETRYDGDTVTDLEHSWYQVSEDGATLEVIQGAMPRAALEAARKEGMTPLELPLTVQADTFTMTLPGAPEPTTAYRCDGKLNDGAQATVETVATALAETDPRQRAETVVTALCGVLRQKAAQDGQSGPPDPARLARLESYALAMALAGQDPAPLGEATEAHMPEVMAGTTTCAALAQRLASETP